MKSRRLIVPPMRVAIFYKAEIKTPRGWQLSGGLFSQS
jgi:hypothetical protein